MLEKKFIEKAVNDFFDTFSRLSKEIEKEKSKDKRDSDRLLELNRLYFRFIKTWQAFDDPVETLHFLAEETIEYLKNCKHAENGR